MHGTISWMVQTSLLSYWAISFLISIEQCQNVLCVAKLSLQRYAN